MQQHFSGELISGELTPDSDEFTVTQIRHIRTQSVMNEQQIRNVYEFLSKAKDQGEESLVISAGSLPVLINRAEIEKLHQDFESILRS